MGATLTAERRCKVGGEGTRGWVGTGQVGDRVYELSPVEATWRSTAGTHSPPSGSRKWLRMTCYDQQSPWDLSLWVDFTVDLYTALSKEFPKSRRYFKDITSKLYCCLKVNTPLTWKTAIIWTSEAFKYLKLFKFLLVRMLIFDCKSIFWGGYGIHTIFIVLFEWSESYLYSIRPDFTWTLSVYWVNVIKT